MSAAFLIGNPLEKRTFPPEHFDERLAQLGAHPFCSNWKVPGQRTDERKTDSFSD